MDRRIWVHPGAHKTASTAIQQNILKNSKGLSNSNCGIIDRTSILYSQEFWPNYAKAVVEVHHGDKSFKSQHAKAAENCLNQLTADKSNTDYIWSDEQLFLGRLGYSSTLYPYAKSALETLAHITRNFDTKYIYFVRSIPEIIESSFLQFLHEGKLISFEKYREKIELTEVSWMPVMQALLDVIGAERVTVRRYDDFLSDAHTTLLSFFDWFGISSSQLDLELKRVNPGFFQIGVDIAHAVLPLLTEAQWPPFRKFIQANYCDTDFARPVLLQASEKAALREKYTQEISEIEVKGLIK